MGLTTGPWEVIEGGYTYARGEFSVHPVGSGGDGERRIACWIRTKADADLIAAAPELLEACEELLSLRTGPWTDDQADIVVGSARAAVAKARGGFTLIELLVVLVIVGIVAIVALPTARQAWTHRQSSEGARILQAALAGARDDALHRNTPSGVRLVPDETTPLQRLPNGQLDPRQLVFSSRILPIRPAPDYSEGGLSVFPPSSYAAAIRTVNGNPGVPCLVVEDSVGHWVQDPVTQTYTFAPDPPTNWFNNVRVGEQIQVNNTGPWYTIVGPMVVNASQGNSELAVNIGPPGTQAPARVLTSPDGMVTVTIHPDYLLLVNGRDDNGNGWTDEGFDGVDNDGDGLTDEADEWEQEAWLGALSGIAP